MTPTTIGEPVIQEFYRGLHVNLEEIGTVLYCLASMAGEEDYDALEKLIKSAQDAVSVGHTAMPSLANAMVSKSLTGSYTAARDKLDEAFEASGQLSYVFEHNAYTMRQSPTLRGVEIKILRTSPEMFHFRVDGRDNRRLMEGLKAPLETVLAEAAGVPRAIRGIDISTPIERVDEGARYRLDFAAFADAARASGLCPAERSFIKEVTGACIADRYESWANTYRSHVLIEPTINLAAENELLSAKMSMVQCKLLDYDIWRDPAIAKCFTREGTVFTGYVQSPNDKPRLCFSVDPAPHAGLAGHEPARELARRLKENITSLHS